jgi:L-threonylcarbamoyladenylate synthase
MVQVAMAALVAAVRSGRTLISFPTDTVPALAARPDCADLIFVAKQRQPDKPLILMAATAAALWDYVKTDDPGWPTWRQIAQRYWPGAMTLVLPASAHLPRSLNPAETGTIGLRIPAWDIARTLLQQTGPLATTSVNLSGQPSLIDLAEIAQAFPQVLTPTATHWSLPPSVTVLGSALDMQPTPSTVVKWTGDGWEVLRQGAVKFRD